ncbi:hypothetical protein E2C06_36540 [Dankookia rubra]|uniref:Uncharacterized protein n=1 Tax=Dankookia rubra TaxID=1442381 RepID=A0A4R5PZX2_9PROT|nr:hypothetical protein [Dankookia rubra]TDH55080.1 hypothetical protein E2C06_36540 [Dankookia rubra]
MTQAPKIKAIRAKRDTLCAAFDNFRAVREQLHEGRASASDAAVAAFDLIRAYWAREVAVSDSDAQTILVAMRLTRGTTRQRATETAAFLSRINADA